MKKIHNQYICKYCQVPLRNSSHPEPNWSDHRQRVRSYECISCHNTRKRIRDRKVRKSSTTYAEKHEQGIFGDPRTAKRWLLKQHGIEIRDWRKLKRNTRQQPHLPCPYCYKSIPITELTLDHKLARQRGGPDHIDNCHLVCVKCNRIKGNLHDHEFTALLEFLQDRAEMRELLFNRLRMASSGFRRHK